MGERGPVGGHGVEAGHGAQADGFLVGAFVAFDADGADRKKCSAGLPDFVIPSAGFEFTDEDGVGAAAGLEAPGGDFADDPHGEAGAGEGVAVEQVVRDAEGGPEFADVILEKFGERLEEASFGLQGEDAIDAVVVGFDARGPGSAGGAFDDVGVERALGKQFDLAGAGEEDIDEFITDTAAFFLGIGDAGQPRKEAVGGVDAVDLEAEATELHDDFVGLAAAEESVVDEDGVHFGAGGGE